MRDALLGVLAASVAWSAQSAPLRFGDVAAIVHADGKRAFAGVRVNAHVPDAALAQAIGTYLGMPGGETPVVNGSFAMIEGCRPHSCIEKAAVIVDMRTRQVAAVALRNYECRHFVMDDAEIAAMAPGANGRAPVRCHKEPILDVYAVRRSLSPASLRAENEQLKQLREWGQRVGHQGERVQIIDRRRNGRGS